MKAWNHLPLLLLLLTCTATAEVSAGTIVGSLTARSEKLEFALPSAEPGSVLVGFPRAQRTTTLTGEQWQKFRQMVQKAVRIAPRVKSNDAQYVGRVGELHVGVTNDESGRYRGSRVAIYMVIQRKSTGINVNKKKWKALTELVEKTDLALKK